MPLVGTPRSVARSTSAIAVSTIGAPARCAISARCARRSFTTPVPIVPNPISPMRTGRAAGTRSAGLCPVPGHVERRTERLLDAADRLPRPVVVLDEGEAHVGIAVLAEPAPGRHGHLRLAQEELRELERAHRLVLVRDLGPDEHGGLGFGHVPPRAVEPLAQHVASLAI